MIKPKQEHFLKTPGSGQTATVPTPPKFKPYQAAAHPRAAEIDALPQAVGMGRTSRKSL